MYQPSPRLRAYVLDVQGRKISEQGNVKALKRMMHPQNVSLEMFR